jgi:hypothetical protein
MPRQLMPFRAMLPLLPLLMRRHFAAARAASLYARRCAMRNAPRRHDAEECAAAAPINNAADARSVDVEQRCNARRQWRKRTCQAKCML